MDTEPLYESEIYQWKLIGSWIGIIALSIFICWLEYWIIRITRVTPGFFFPLLFSAVVIGVLGGLLVLIVRHFIAKKPKLFVYNSFIYIDEEKIPLEAIKNIKHNAQEDIRLSFPKELVIINLKDETELKINVGYYRNGYLFRSVCEKIQTNIARGIFEIKDFTPPEVIINPVPFEELQNEPFEKYLGNPFPILLLVIITLAASVFLLFGHIKGAHYGTNFLLSAFFFGLFLIFGRFLNYLLISPKYVVVRNHLYFWEKTIFPIDDIKRFQIVIIRSGRGSSAKLFIMTRDYKLNRFTINVPSWDDKTVDVVNDYIKKK